MFLQSELFRHVNGFITRFPGTQQVHQQLGSELTTTEKEKKSEKKNDKK
jgi:hypothetical protein